MIAVTNKQGTSNYEVIKRIIDITDDHLVKLDQGGAAIVQLFEPCLPVKKA